MITLAGVQYISSLIAGTSAPANTHFGLSSTTPTWEGTGSTEPTDANYARQALPSTAAGWGAVVDTTEEFGGTTYHAGGLPTAAAVTFPAPTANDGVQTHLCWWDAVTGGSLFGYIPLSTPLMYTMGEELDFASGQELFLFLGEAS